MTLRPDRFPIYRLYGDLADLWPLVNAPEDYAHEASLWRRALRQRLGRGRRSLLDLGAGGGFLLSHLAPAFEATAVDASDAMLAHSLRLNPSVEHVVGDMRTVRLGRSFDAVLVHDAINYMTAEDDLRATFATARAHLQPGGVLVVAPDWYRETLGAPHVSYATRSRDDLEVTFVGYSWDPDPDDSTFEALYLYFVRRGAALVIEEDRHPQGLFALRTWVALMREAGFRVEKLPYLTEQDHRAPWLLVGSVRGRQGP